MEEKKNGGGKIWPVRKRSNFDIDRRGLRVEIWETHFAPMDFCNNFYFQSFLIGSKSLKIKVVATCKNQLSTLRALFSTSKWNLFLQARLCLHHPFFRLK